MYLGSNIKFLRKKSGLTGVAFSKKLGKFTRGAVSHWERGTSYPDIQTLIQITEEFDVSLDDLIYKDLSTGVGRSEHSRAHYNVQFIKFTSDNRIFTENQYYFPGLPKEERGYISFRYAGDELGSCIRSRDMIFATHIDMEDFMSDGIYVFYLKDRRAYTKIARKMANDEYMLYSNSGLPPITVQEDDIIDIYKVKYVLHQM